MGCMKKDFQDWFVSKQKLDNKEHKPPLVSQGDIWWVALGENIGSEIYGKGEFFTRPGIIFKKLSRKLYLIIPTTSKYKTGSWFVPFSQDSKKNFACLHQIRIIDYRRLFSKMGTLDHSDLKRVRIAFERLFL